MLNQSTLKIGLIGLAVSLSLSGCALLPTKRVNNPPIKPTPYQANKSEPKTVQESLAAQTKIVKFNNYDELKDFLEKNEPASGLNYGGGFGMGMRRELAIDATIGVAPQMMEEKSAITAPSSIDVGASTDYSKTNIQVEGVDEADIIKTDGKYIYAVVKNDLFIVDAKPADKANIVAKIAFKARPQEIYIDKDSLIVYGQEEQNYDIMPYERFRRYSPYTFFKVFDLSDRKNPTQVRDLSFEGSFNNSRMIGDYVYFVTNNYNYTYLADQPILPKILDGGVELANNCAGGVKCFMPDVYYFDIPYNSYNFTSVNAINVKNNTEQVKGDVYILDANQNMYVSENNIYITYTKYISEYQLTMEVTREILYPRLSEKDKSRIDAIEKTENFILSKDEKFSKISMILERFIQSLTDVEQTNLQNDLVKAVKQKYTDLSKELEKTVIHKIGINKGELEYKTFGEVTGAVLNQFSMDEKDGYFRIATTKNRTWSSFEENNQKSYNNLYVLDSNLKIVGKVENLAEGEQIYSVRFMQDRAYMVTFVQTDPLFVIDLKNPADPKVIGKLKIPGFSSYLHPYDNNLLIGIGKDAEANEWGGATTKGLKLALFDVSDPNNLKEVDSYVLGGQGSDSIALNDHKAFLFSKEKNLLAIPVSLTEQTGKDTWGRLNFVGTTVFTITEKGFELKGKIDHSDGGRPSQGDFWMGYDYYDNTVRRNLYIDNILYSFSNNYLKMNKLEDMKEVNNLSLIKKGGGDFEVVN